MRLNHTAQPACGPSCRQSATSPPRVSFPGKGNTGDTPPCAIPRSRFRPLRGSCGPIRRKRLWGEGHLFCDVACDVTPSISGGSVLLLRSKPHLEIGAPRYGQVVVCVKFCKSAGPARPRSRPRVIPPEPPVADCALPERRAVRKGAPGFGAAERTLAREHRSGIGLQLRRVARRDDSILLVSSERCFTPLVSCPPSAVLSGIPYSGTVSPRSSSRAFPPRVPGSTVNRRPRSGRCAPPVFFA